MSEENASLAEVMDMPFWLVCSNLQDRMARNGTTEDFLNIKFNDVTFRLTATAKEVPQTIEEYLEGKVWENLRRNR